MKSRAELINLKNESNFVTLPMMLETREKRVQKQDELLKNCSCLVCFTMNIAGPYKYSEVIEKAFFEGLDKLRQLLGLYNIHIKNEAINIEITGAEGYLPLDTDPLKIKKLTVQIEDNFPLGRLFDIDVIKPNGEKVSRGDVGMPSRNCMICGSEGTACARSRAHSVEQLQQFTIDTICNYFNDKYAETLAKKAVKSLLYEVSVTPKPGLVDRFNNGAHSDMNFYTFIDSSVALRSYFKNCALKAIDMFDKSPAEIFDNLRYIGLIAEQNMFSATKGVNTHKGAIFSFGLVTAASAYLWANDKGQNIDDILDICAQMAKGSLKDFEKSGFDSFGKQLYQNKKLTGIRGQAAEGYPAVKEVYSLLKQMLNSGENIDTAGGKVLLRLMSFVEDTNIIKRSDFETLKTIQQRIKTEDIDLNKLNGEFISKNISPGGCADLLAICFLLYFICE